MVCLDETWAKTNVARLYGRAPRGERVVGRVPHARWETTTFLSAMRTTGLVAPLCVAGAINGEIFLAWVRQHLVRELKAGDVAVMDNLSSHKVRGVREAIEAVGASVAYLPAYSPDFNPIELAFNKFKAVLRAGAARTTDALWRLCGEACDRITPTDCRAFFNHCGYRYG